MRTKTSRRFGIALLGVLLGGLASPSAVVAQAEQAAPPSGGSPGGGGSGDDSASLANQATNPAAALIQLQLQNTFQPQHHGAASGYSNMFVIQPVVPFSLGKESYFQNLIWRGTLPIISQPDYKDLGAGTTRSTPAGSVAIPAGIDFEGKTELGDFANLFIPAHKQKVSDTFGFEWGPIFAMSIPTATDPTTGTEKLSIGPGGLVIGSKKNLFTEGDTLQFGIYAYQWWSVAGNRGRPEVSEMFMGPIATYHFATLLGMKNWYLRWTDELSSYNWKESSDEVVQFPVGLAVGRVFSIGKRPVNVFLAGNYNALYRGSAPIWDIKLNFTLLFPE
jgi:hypothetical protein